MSDGMLLSKSIGIDADCSLTGTRIASVGGSGIFLTLEQTLNAAAHTTDGEQSAPVVRISVDNGNALIGCAFPELNEPVPKKGFVVDVRCGMAVLGFDVPDELDISRANASENDSFVDNSVDGEGRSSLTAWGMLRVRFCCCRCDCAPKAMGRDIIID